MKITFDDCLISVKDVKSIFIQRKNKHAPTREERRVRVEADPYWGVFKRKWYSVRSYLFGYPTRKEVIEVTPPQHWVLSMEYDDEDDKRYTFSCSHEDRNVVKSTYDQIIKQLPDSMMARVNKIMFEDEKKS